VLARALAFAPAGVHLAVVDPGVGGRRRAVALRTAREDRLLVGPDNGLLVPAAEAFGGVAEAVEISASPWRLEPVSATFHGRDVFAPVAARLAGGEPLEAAGRALEPGELVGLDRTSPALEEDGTLVAHAVLADAFGNVQLDAGRADLDGTGVRLGLRVRVVVAAGETRVPFVRTFGDVSAGEPLLYEDPARMLALAVGEGSAAERFGLRPGDEVRIRPA
jgi:S-adenosyl-L-methionine hydrolase (adenosine-forming)